MLGVEIDMVVKDSLEALKTYKKVFKAEEVESSDYNIGFNEAVFTIHNSRFHMLDENEEYMLYAPNKDIPNSIWFNILVKDIEETFNKAEEENFKIIHPLTEVEELGIINAILLDPYGYQWMLHQIVKEVNFEKRKEFMEKEFSEDLK
ncbi:hypothetical protein LJB96_04005 [Methanobrevibacter sp. OttesenSCG-928-K11]|nr:hypothetical protein [Methanobrevibacter sp. OttesenSCG-928-K11]MDL2271271.1 hypothetical protein [Methanobrevibacter sp. OttesenSCG-928-I08]